MNFVSPYIAFDVSMLSMDWEGCGMKWLWSILRYCYNIFCKD
jgi:hypothetical protein